MLNFDTFRNCPNEYRTAPFWSWNDSLDPANLIAQIRSMREQGMGGFFMHPRAGMDDEYLGERFMAAIGACIDEADSTGMLAWLYDEDTFPSGFAGGKVLAESDDHAARYLCVVKGSADECPPGMCWQFVITQHGWIPKDKQSAEANHGQTFTFSIGETSSVDRFARKPYPDLCNPDVTDAFIRNTHECYAETFGSHFAGAVPGIFTDEPNFKPRQEKGKAVLPWTALLSDEFIKRKGYDLTTKLPELFFETANCKKTRFDYWDVISALFVESFTKRVYQWCDEHGLTFTGHFWEHVWPSPQHNGSVMPNYEYMHIPGIDMLFNTREEQVQFGNDLIVKEASSVANQLGKDRVLSETHGASGWNLPLYEQKRMIDWQLALGVNLICQHLVHVSLRGYRKRDFPLSFIHEPWWDAYRLLGDYTGRLCYILTRGKATGDVLVLHSASSSWAEFDPLEQSDVLETVGSSLYSLCKTLSGIRVFYDLGDEELLGRHGSVFGPSILVGLKAYSTVVVPSMTNLKSETLDLLREFSDEGGKILSSGATPELLDGLEDEELKVFFEESVEPVHQDDKSLCSALANNEGVVLESRDGLILTDIYCNKRLTEEEEILFFCNINRNSGYEISLLLEQPFAYEWWDLETGTRLPADVYTEDGQWKIDFTLEPCGSALLVGETGSTVEVLSGPIELKEPTQSVQLTKWSASRTDYNALTLNRCQASLDGGLLSREQNFLVLDDEFKTQLSLPRADISAPQPWTFSAEERASVHDAVASYTFDIQSVPEGDLHLCVESPEIWAVDINGVAVTPEGGFYKSREFNLYGIKEHVIDGANVVTLKTSMYGVLTSLESVYVVGDFALSDSGSIVEESAEFPMGDWTTGGYPYYSGAVQYTASADLNGQGENVLRIHDFMGDAIRVYVNGVAAGVIGWRPYALDLTKYVSNGTNEITVEVMNSMQNLMGPHHSLPTEGIVTPGSFYAAKDTVFIPSGFFGDAEIRFYQ